MEHDLDAVDTVMTKIGLYSQEAYTYWYILCLQSEMAGFRGLDLPIYLRYICVYSLASFSSFDPILFFRPSRPAFCL